ncbi:hypothetical protein [Saccharicrinis aurantiacus]|nr:hypothetical protein [Saccharicrinis aurantiacus]
MQNLNDLNVTEIKSNELTLIDGGSAPAWVHKIVDAVWDYFA